MNATATDFNQEINGGSDSETSADDTPEYYQPISAEGSDSDSDPDPDGSESLPNGYHAVEDGMSSMDINGGVLEEKSGSEDEEEEEGNDESTIAIARAFREDENRRNAPLTPENASRVMEAMRRISFGGSAPDWVTHVPDHRWMDHLTRIRIRQPPPSSSTHLQN